MKRSKRILFTLDIEMEKKLGVIKMAYGATSQAQALRNTILMTYNSLMNGSKNFIVPLTDIKLIDDISRSEPKKEITKGRPALSYAEKQQAKLQRSLEREDYEHSLCLAVGGVPNSSGCKFDRYEKANGRILKWTDTVQPYYEVIKPYFYGWALGGFHTKEEAEKQYQKEKKQRDKEMFESMKQKEETAIRLAQIQEERLAKVNKKDLEEIAKELKIQVIE